MLSQSRSAHALWQTSNVIISSLFLVSVLPIYTTMWVSGSVSGDYTHKCLLSKPLLRPGWRQFLQYKWTQDCVSVRVYSVVQLGPSELAFKTRFAFNERGISPKHKETKTITKKEIKRKFSLQFPPVESGCHGQGQLCWSTREAWW